MDYKEIALKISEEMGLEDDEANFEFAQRLIAAVDAERGKDSEKEANAILTQERDALAMQNQQMRDALEGARHVLDELYQSRMNPNWFTNGERAATQHFLLWSDKGKKLLGDALALPDHTEIIKRHDASVLRKAADVCESRQTPGTGSVAILSGAANALREMAAELEK